MTTNDSDDTYSDSKGPFGVEALTKMLSFLNYLDSVGNYRPSPNEIECIVNYFLNLPKVELTADMRATSESSEHPTVSSSPKAYQHPQIEDILFIRPIYLDDEALVTKILIDVQKSPGIINVNLNEKKNRALIQKIFDTGEYGGFIAFIEDEPVGLGVISTMIGALGKIELYIRETLGQEEVAHGLVGELVRLAMVLEYKSLFCKLTVDDKDYESVLRRKGFFAATDDQIRPLFERINESPDSLLFIMPKVPKIPRIRLRRLEE